MMTDPMMTAEESGMTSPPPSFNRKGYLNELGLSQLHHYVGPDNESELQAVHRDAYPTAIFYLTTILGLYFCGLVVILIHYMNSSYGKWAWTLNDVWDELRPTMWKASPSGQSTQDKGTSEQAGTAEDKNVICDDEEECHLHQNKPKKVSNHLKKKIVQKFSCRRIRKNTEDLTHFKEETEKQPLNGNRNHQESITVNTDTVNNCSITAAATASAAPKIEVVAVHVDNAGRATSC